MMRERLLALAEHRTRLALRAESERAELSAMLAPADAAAALAASVARVASGLAEQAARYPWIVVAGVALLAALRPRRAMSWLTRGYSMWRLYRGAQGVWQRFSGARMHAAARTEPPGQPW